MCTDFIVAQWEQLPNPSLDQQCTRYYIKWVFQHFTERLGHEMGELWREGMDNILNGY